MITFLLSWLIACPFIAFAIIRMIRGGMIQPKR